MKWNVFAKRNGQWTKMNRIPMSEREARDLIADIERATIPSITETTMDFA